MRAMKSHFTSWVDEGTGTGSVRNATHTRAIQSHFRAKEQTSLPRSQSHSEDIRNAVGTRAMKSHFTYGVVDLSWEGKRTGIQEVIYAEQNSYTNNR